MKKIYTKLLTGLLCMLATVGANAQVTVTNPSNTTPSLAATYADLASTIAALNAQTAISGPVTITLDPANPQTSPAGGYAINATLAGASSTNTVTISGSNNIITAPTTHTVGALNDAFFKIIGSDFITIQNFTMQENAANLTTAAASNNMTEWGVALLYASTTNGAQNCTIQNNSITLNKIYQNTFGIYSSSVHSATAVSTGISATTASGGNSGLKLYGNNISNVNNGIVIIGPLAAVDFNTGMDIGGSSSFTGNTISNYGTGPALSGYFSVSGTLFGVLVRNSTGINVSYNSITSANGGNTLGTLRGIYVPAFTVAPTGTFTNNFNNNTIAVTTGLATGAVQGITIENTTGTTTSTTNINSNNFTAAGYNVASPTGITSVIASIMPNLVTSISNNTFTNISSTSTGTFTFISNAVTVPAGGSQTINNNSIVTAFSKTGLGGAVTGITSTGTASGNITQNWNNNNFSNMTVSGTSTFTFLNNTDGGSVNHNIIGNTFSNITGGTGAIVGIISNFGGGNGGSGNLASGNTISNITSAGAITGIAIGSSSTASSTVTGNTISGFTSTGASAVIGITSGAPTSNTIAKNTICNLEANNASGTVSGIAVTGGTLHNIINNRIGDLRTTLANAANPLNGLNITGGTTVNVYFNTINLNATSTGALFGSSAINASTTPALTLNNNIFVNTSTPAGATGFTVAYRRSSLTLTTYTASSDRNLFFAGTPSANNFIHYDGTNSFQALADYKAMTVPETLAPRDANSISENPNFISTTCGNAGFLKINAAIATGIESGGINITGITDDFENDIRQGNTGYAGSGTAPDLGADEFGITVLPVSIEFFRAAKQTNGNLLEWKVSCTNSSYATLTLERSADGRSFTGIHTQHATSLRCQSPFSYTDATALTGINYYRLKMTDANGKTTYSQLLVIMNKEKGFEIVGLNPNPVYNAANLNLTAATASKIVLMVTDMSGRLMQKQSVQLQAGSNLIPLKVTALSAGYYQVTVINEAGEKTSIRFVKQ